MNSSYGITDQLRMTVPRIISLLLVLIAASPVLAGMQMVPAFWVVVIFFWRIYSPGALGYVWVFMLGLLSDALLAVPLGIHALSALCGALLLERFARRIMRQPFRLIWVAAALFAALMLMLSAALVMLSGEPVTSLLVLKQWVATALFYPLFHVMLSLMARMLPPPAMRA